MLPILDLATKDLLQMLRDRKTFLFLLLMPIAFTLLFGFVLNSTAPTAADARLPVGLLNRDPAAPFSLALESLLSSSNVIRLEPYGDVAALEEAVIDQSLAAAVIIPAGYGQLLQSNLPVKLTVIADPAIPSGLSAQTEIGVAAGRLNRAIHTAQAMASQGRVSFAAAFDVALAAWQNPPVRLVEAPSQTALAEPRATPAADNNFAHSSPGMILQFAIAGLLTCAQVIVSERKNRCLQRLLTTATGRVQILLGHYLAIFLLIFSQFVILILFGQFVLKLDYFTHLAATFLIALTAALCISALGLLIGILSKSEEQAVTYALIGMFILAGLGGAWVPLEFTGSTFQRIGHLTPLAWAMDGFKDILVRGLGLTSVLLPAAVLLGYAVLFFGLSAGCFYRHKDL
ncbi:MAG TPA: ABC transporter permease [Anaerolineaceae bacterium]|nr:ABC transporter permease [Anaerolineaceae bacterium]